MLKIPSTCLFLLVVLYSCTTTHSSTTPRAGVEGAVLLNPAIRYPVVPPDEVRIIVDASELDTIKFDYVAQLEVSSTGGVFLLSSPKSQTELIEQLRSKAGRVGANAIILPEFSRSGTNAVNTRKGKTLAIRIFYSD